MAGKRELAKQRHKDVRELFQKLSDTGKYKYTWVVGEVARKTRYSVATVERIIATKEEEDTTNILTLFQ